MAYPAVYPVAVPISDKLMSNTAYSFRLCDVLYDEKRVAALDGNLKRLGLLGSVDIPGAGCTIKPNTN